MSGEIFTINISGNSNDSNLLLASSNGTITESGNLDVSNLDLRTTTLEGKTATLEGKTASLEIPETVTKNLRNGPVQTWKTVGGNYHNTNNLDNLVNIAKHSIASLNHFKIEPIPNEFGSVGASRYCGLVDEHHFYQLVTATNKNPFTNEYIFGLVGHREDPVILKFDRFTGKYVSSLRLVNPEKAYDICGNLVNVSSGLNTMIS